ncbi:hypothetical protein SAMN05216196_10538 [Lutimaribacter pacificus]|uniref:Uncharacterized protein n=1 Tax=Lutimaribacter pacificus TaxID=391948 RepID=A0A1H0IW13_9RHOB|nr:hypothetical protein [Lutimaribacter pacificus]SDO35678.1 hypothetical protein SAMN05216196_10538 [Lutimaribacter pacificus]SHK16883.1 hypothetical protein SAMN05444142_103502 [Lutimaribacter pacificus]
MTGESGRWLGVLALGLALAMPGAALAEGGTVAARRAAAEAQSAEGARTGDAALLIAGLRGLLASGATLAPDDPWNASAYMARLRELSAESGDAHARDIAILTARARGSSGGFSRFDLELAPGADEAFTLRVVGAEAAIVEARLKRGSGAADVDLIVTGPDGAVRGSDIGPSSGIVGIAAYVEFVPETCLDITATLVNAGTETARIAVISPPALEPRCDP